MWSARDFGNSFKAILYVQMLVSFEHVVAAMVSALLKEKETVIRGAYSSTSPSRGKHGWRFTARIQVVSK